MVVHKNDYKLNKLQKNKSGKVRRFYVCIRSQNT